MKIIVGWIVCLGCAAVTLARPIIIEERFTLRSPDVTRYPSFGGQVAIDGDFALVVGSRSEVTDQDFRPLNYRSALLFRRNGSQWEFVQPLVDEDLDNNDFSVEMALAMKNDIAAVSAWPMQVFERTAAGWVLAPSTMTAGDGPGSDLEINGARILNGDGTCSWDAHLYEKPAGTWTETAILHGNYKGCDDEFRGGPVDIDGDWAVVAQPRSEDVPFPEVLLYFNRGPTQGGWSPFSGLRASEGVTTFGPEVAIRGQDIFVGGSNQTGTFLYRRGPLGNWVESGRLQTADSFMGAGVANTLEKSPDFILQHSWNYDRNAAVINAFRERTDGTFEHVAVLAAKHGVSLGGSVDISGRRVMVGGFNAAHYFELPASFAVPAVIQDTFNSGTAAEWTSSGGNYAVAQRGTTRLYRQSNVERFTVSVRGGSDFTTQSIQTDVRPREFGSANSWVGVATRYQNDQNYFYAQLQAAGRVVLRRAAGGVHRTLATAALPVQLNRNHQLRLESAGTLHHVYVDGRLMLDVDSGGPTHGNAAVLTFQAAADYDNVVVSPSPRMTGYETDFEGGTAGPWTLDGMGFWNLWSGASTVYNQSSVLADARASIGVPVEDQVVQLRTRLDTFASPTGAQERWFGVMARHVDADNFYYLSMRSSNTVQLRKVVNGVVTPLASVPFTVQPATWYRLRLDAVGDQLRGYVNGAMLMEATDADIARGVGGAVTFKAAADFDDFKFYQP